MPVLLKMGARRSPATNVKNNATEKQRSATTVLAFQAMPVMKFDTFTPKGRDKPALIYFLIS